jgi:hypothetical protein
MYGKNNASQPHVIYETDLRLNLENNFIIENIKHDLTQISWDLLTRWKTSRL